MHKLYKMPHYMVGLYQTAIEKLCSKKYIGEAFGSYLFQCFYTRIVYKLSFYMRLDLNFDNGLYRKLWQYNKIIFYFI